MSSTLPDDAQRNIPNANAPAQVDRRTGLGRRDAAGNPVARKPANIWEDEDGDLTGLERRRGPGRRRTDFNKSAEEGEMTPEQFMFVMAIESFKTANNKIYPTWTDVLEVVRLLGYRKTQACQLKLRNVDDWTEAGDTGSGVRSKPGHPEAGGGSKKAA